MYLLMCATSTPTKHQSTSAFNTIVQTTKSYNLLLNWTCSSPMFSMLYFALFMVFNFQILSHHSLLTSGSTIPYNIACQKWPSLPYWIPWIASSQVWQTKIDFAFYTCVCAPHHYRLGVGWTSWSMLMQIISRKARGSNPCVATLTIVVSNTTPTIFETLVGPTCRPHGSKVLFLTTKFSYFIVVLWTVVMWGW